KRLTVPAQADFEVEILFGQESLKRHDQVTVSPASADTLQAGAQLEHRLEGPELRNLSGALFGDALRSLQTLPGAAAGDEFYAELVYRGAGPSEIGYYLDGARIQLPYHGFRQVGELGSVSLFNSETVASVTAAAATSSARFSDGAAAVLTLDSK